MTFGLRLAEHRCNRAKEEEEKKIEFLGWGDFDRKVRFCKLPELDRVYFEIGGVMLPKI